MKRTNDKPQRIPFCAEMVPKVLDGSKTQTRRIGGLQNINEWPDMWAFEGFSADGALFESSGKIFQCPPRYHVGDVICISERWITLESHDDVPPRLLPEFIPLRYPSNDDIRFGETEKFSCNRWGKYRPSIHQPVWACRPWRGRIIDVRCERVQDISLKDIVAEGLCRPKVLYGKAGRELGAPIDPWTEWEKLWDSVNGPGDYAMNKWVFVYAWEPI